MNEFQHVQKSVNKFKTLLYFLASLWVIVLYFIGQPAINLQSFGFYFYIFFALVPFLILSILFNSNLKIIKNKVFLKGILIFIAIVIALSLIGSPYLGGLNYYMNRIHIDEVSTIADMDSFKEGQVQVIDKDASESLADRVFGEMGSSIVSQYQISDNYAQCVVDNALYRITPVEYSGFIKWLSTNKNGTPGYISVNITDGTTEFHKVEEGFKVTRNALFLNNLDIKLRLKYPTKIFGYTKFEVDDNWNPYWVTQVLSYKFIGKAEDVEGVIITSPIDGSSNYYKVGDVPEWVDNVYNASQILEQYDTYSKYKNGLFNFAQKGVTETTDDYSYLQKDGHLWIYTGITSAGNDESNVGYMYADLQDKEIIYVESAGAEEYSAKASAEGALQEKGYESTFPVLVNLDNQETYFMGLKDNAGLIKAYAFVSYKNYQKYGVGTTIDEAIKNYTGKNILVTDSSEMKTITVKDIQNAVVDGNTVYYILSTDGEYYSCSIETSAKLPFVKQGDVLTVLVSDTTILSID